MKKSLAVWMTVAVLVSAASVPCLAGGGCRAMTFEGEVKAGESFYQPIGSGLVFDLEAVKAGWIVRVLPLATFAGKAPRAEHDAAELATPPYNSVTPLAITTDFSFRAQDAVAWNPRRFSFAADAASFAKLQAAYATYMKNPDDAKVGEELAELAAAAVPGTLQILDARIIPGSANQSPMAAAVASHFSETPHSLDPGSSPLGALTWVKFRVTVPLPKGFAVAPGLKPQPCKS